MNVAEHIVTSQNWTTGRQGNNVTGIVLHTMVGTTAGSQARFNDPASQVSVHYGVSLDGSITRWVEEANTAWQAGNWDVNLKTIGIEHEDNGNANDSVRTQALYESSSDLVADICRRYNIPADTNHIFLHKNVIDKSRYPGGTSCPDGLDTNKIISMAAAKLEGANDVMDKNDAIAYYWNTLHRRYDQGQVSDAELNGLIGKKLSDIATAERTSQEWLTQNFWLLEGVGELQKQIDQLNQELTSSNASDESKQILADMQAVIDKYKAN